jgi:protoporphyrinogen oxidase
MGKHENRTVIIIGAGPAGLTAAYELCKAGVRPIVLEQESSVGGLAKTINHKGFRFDIGGHRFYTKVKAADDLWREVLPAEDSSAANVFREFITTKISFTIHCSLRPRFSKSVCAMAS